ncbi:MAG: hypothetical protein R6U84_07980 [Candidatus Cloacimonadales bacterium]
MSQFYYKINLNKYGEMKQQAERQKKTFINLTVTFSVITAVMIGFLFYNVSLMNKKIENRADLLKDIKQEIKSYQVSGEYLSSSDLNRIAEVSSNRIFWAKKLVALSEKTTDKIAITHFSYKSGKLSLFGITKLDKDVKEFDLIDSFIGDLKANKQISEDFPDIQFVKSTTDYEKDVQILRFQIDAKIEDQGKRGRI